jgi:hypothetical protein
VSTIINVGDTVTVEWEGNLEPIKGVVRYLPVATGDSFHIETPADTVYNIAPRIIYVQTFARMTRYQPKPPKSKI